MTEPNSGGVDVSGSVQEFARELRELRASAGSPSFRTMAAKVHFAPSTLAAATRGLRLPSRPVVEAFATACGADPAEWAIRWKTVASTVPAFTVAPSADPRYPPPGRSPARPAPARIIGLVALLVAVAAVGMAARPLVFPPATPTASQTLISTSALPGLRVPADGTNPDYVGCELDETKLGEATVTADGVEQGYVQLYYSPSCEGGWASFFQAAGLANPLAAVTVTAPDDRASTLTEVPSRVPKGDVPPPTHLIVTDLLHAVGTCLVASAVVHLTTGQRATASTGCLAG